MADSEKTSTPSVSGFYVAREWYMGSTHLNFERKTYSRT